MRRLCQTTSPSHSSPKASSVAQDRLAPRPGTVRVASTSSMRTQPFARPRRARRASSRRRPPASRNATARWARARSGRDRSRQELRGDERILEAFHEPLERLAFLAGAPRHQEVAAGRGCHPRMPSRPASPRARRSSAARSPRPGPRRSAAALASREGTVSVSCPVSRPTVRGGSRREVSAMLTARCAGSRRRHGSSLTRGWNGAATNTISTRPSLRRVAAARGRVAARPIARSARPEASASQVPPRTSWARRSRVPDVLRRTPRRGRRACRCR